MEILEIDRDHPRYPEIVKFVKAGYEQTRRVVLHSFPSTFFVTVDAADQLMCAIGYEKDVNGSLYTNTSVVKALQRQTSVTNCAEQVILYGTRGGGDLIARILEQAAQDGKSYVIFACLEPVARRVRRLTHIVNIGLVKRFLLPSDVQHTYRHWLNERPSIYLAQTPLINEHRGKISVHNK